VLCEHETGEANAVRVLADLLHSGVSIPYIILTQDPDEHRVAEIIRAGTWNYLAKSRLDGATLFRSIHGTITLHFGGMQSSTASMKKLDAILPGRSTQCQTSRQRWMTISFDDLLRLVFIACHPVFSTGAPLP
jgi:DNA-binding NarL/FixJ family response regulator